MSIGDVHHGELRVLCLYGRRDFELLATVIKLERERRAFAESQPPSRYIDLPQTPQ